MFNIKKKEQKNEIQKRPSFSECIAQAIKIVSKLKTEGKDSIKEDLEEIRDRLQGKEEEKEKESLEKCSKCGVYEKLKKQLCESCRK